MRHQSRTEEQDERRDEEIMVIFGGYLITLQLMKSAELMA